MLSLARAEADIVSISLLDRGPNPPTFADKVGWVRDAAGARLADIELHVNVNAVEPNATPETPGAPNRLLAASMPSASSSSTGARSTASRTSPCECTP